MPGESRIVAVGLLTAADVEALGAGFSQLYPVDETPCFNGLLLAIDEADLALRGPPKIATDVNPSR